MRKVMSCILAILLAIIAITPLSMAASVYKVSLNVDFIPNIIFSKYDVDVYLNEVALATIPHGQDFSDFFYAEEGTNTFYFYEHGMPSVKGTIKFEVKDDTSVSCKLSCYHDYIDLYGEKITTENVNTDSANEHTTRTTVPTEVFEVVNEVPTVIPTATPAPTQIPVQFSDIDLHAMSDDELIAAADAIKAEQRSRLRTKVVLDKTDIVLGVGKTDKIIGMVVDLPEGEVAPKLEWSTTDKTVATCNNGQVKAIAAGNTTITCSATLTDGTVIYEECTAQIIIPVSSVTTEKATIKINVEDTYAPTYSVKPKNASEQGLSFESSKSEVAFVDSQGVITGLSAGSAVITATTIDGSQKKCKITVNVVDNRGSLGTNVVTLTGKKTGIVCETISSSIPDTNGIFKNAMTKTIVATMTAAQLLQVNKSFNVDVADSKNYIMYVGISKNDKDTLYMSYKDTDGQYWMVSVIAKENKILYGTDKFTEEKALRFMEFNCTRYEGVTAADYFRANNEIAMYE